MTHSRVQDRDVTLRDRCMLIGADRGASTISGCKIGCQTTSEKRKGITVSTDQYVVVLRVTVLYSRKGCLGPRKSLVWKCADVARVITIWPL